MRHPQAALTCAPVARSPPLTVIDRRYRSVRACGGHGALTLRVRGRCYLAVRGDERCERGRRVGCDRGVQAARTGHVPRPLRVRAGEGLMQ